MNLTPTVPWTSASRQQEEITCLHVRICIGGVQYQMAPLKEAIRHILCCDFSKRSRSNKMSAHYTQNKGCYEDKCIIYGARA